MKQIVAIVSVTVLLGCAVPESKIETTPISTVRTVPWARAEIVGHTFTLVATKQVEVFTFRPDGTTPATIGTKDVMAGPIFSWHLDPGGNLIVKDDELYTTVQKVVSKGNTVEVLRDGKPVTYTVKKGK